MNYPRGALTAQIARKGKERDNLFNHTINGSGNATAHPYYPTHLANTTSIKQKPSEPIWSNRLLAGYLVHEFLTQGSLLGHKFDPAGANAVPLFTATEQKRKPTDPPRKSYAEVARILKADGAQIPGIVNPTQLARWIQM